MKKIILNMGGYNNRNAIKFGLKERPYFNKNIVVKEIKVDKNRAKDIEELLNKLMED